MSRFFDALNRADQEKGGQQVRDSLRQEIRSVKEEAEFFGTQVLDVDHISAIYCQAKGTDTLVNSAGGEPKVREKFSVLRHRLNRMRLDRPLQSLLITSAIANEGKSFITCNLALTLASSSSRVLLLESDLRGPKINEVLGIDVLPGLAEVLEGRLDVSAVIRFVKPLGFFCMQAGHPTRNPAELYESVRLTQLLKFLGRSFDWILLDSPPVNAFADSQCLAHACDAVLMVVRPSVTLREELQKAMAALEGTRVAGVVVNGSTDARTEKYYYSSASLHPDRSKNNRK